MTEHSQESKIDLRINIPPQKELGGISILKSTPGDIEYGIDIPETVLNYHHKIHGGFISTLLEIAAGMATSSHGFSNVAITAYTNFIRAVGAQHLLVKAKTTHLGRSTSVIHSSIETDEGLLVCEATHTMFILGPL